MSVMSDSIDIADETPKWLNIDFLRLHVPDIVGESKIKRIENACAKGENFASKIYRVVLEFEDGATNSLIVKSRPTGNGSSDEFVKKFNVFPKEIEMYDFVNRFEDIYRETGHDISFAPSCIKCINNDPTDILIIEDLNSKGYKLAKKSGGLKQQEMELALKKLAKFHASSAVYHQKFGPFSDKFSRGIYNENMTEWFASHYDANFVFILRECFDTWPSLDKKIIAKMQNWREFVLKELIRTMKPKPGDFSCLTHGDAWHSNILFSYDSKDEPVDCQLIDFQQCVWSSPAVDLWSLIITSAETSTKIQNVERFIKFYHEHLSHALKLLRYPKDIPTQKELYMDVLDRSFLGVWHGIAVLPMCLSDDLQDSSTENLIGEDEAALNYKRKLYNNECYQKHMSELLTYFDNRGLVELSS